MRNHRLPALLAGTATAALLLSACGSDGATTTAPAPVAPVSSAAAPAPEATESPSSRPSLSAPASPSASAPAQEVDLPSGNGFVAIYTRDGQLLASTEVRSGSSRNLTVDLNPRIPATGGYRAVLFGDDGDGDFDPESDPRGDRGQRRR